MKRLVINVVGFYVGWFACVLGAAEGYPLAGPLAVLVGGSSVVHARAPRLPARRDPFSRIMSLAHGIDSHSVSLLVDSRANTRWSVYEPVRWILPAPFATHLASGSVGQFRA